MAPIYSQTWRTKLWAILPGAMLAVAALAAVPAAVSAQSRDAANALINKQTVTLGNRIVAHVRPHRSGVLGQFTLRTARGGVIPVTFDECNNNAKTTCTFGVQDVEYDDHGDDKPATGNCSFSCFAAPSAGD